jgi:hypothetical protein
LRFDDGGSMRTIEGIKASGRSAMRRKFSNPRDRLHLAGVVILVAGLLAAVFVYISAAGQTDPEAIGYRIVGGQAYAIAPDDSAHELQQLERLGGKAAVMTFKFQRWFSSMWHGQRLAYPLLVLSAAIALLCFHIASLMGD